MRHARPALVAVGVILAAAVLGSLPARAQQTGGATSTTTTRRNTTTTEDPYYREATTTTTAKPATTTTTAAPTGPTTTTTAPGDAPDPTVPRTGGNTGGGNTGGGNSGGGTGGRGEPGDPPDDQPARPLKGSSRTPAPGGGDGDEPGATREIPPGYEAMIRSIKRSKPNNTAALLAALRPLEDFGVDPARIPVIGFGRFPVGGRASFVDDWWFPRYTPSFHLHVGTDIFAAHGTPVRAPVDGTVRKSNGAVGGLAVYVTQADGTYFYMAHLAGFAPGLADGQRVKVGDVVGYVGDTGNALGGPPHVHLQLHPRGGGPVNPKPFLDKFISEALANVPRLIAVHEAGRPRAIVTTGLTRRLGEGPSGVFAAPASPPRSQLLWASATSAGGALRLAEAELSEVRRDLDWDAVAKAAVDRRVAFEEADRLAAAMLGPLTPPALAAFLELPMLPRTTSLVAAGPVAGAPRAGTPQAVVAGVSASRATPKPSPTPAASPQSDPGGAAGRSGAAPGRSGATAASGAGPSRKAAAPGQQKDRVGR